MNKPFNNSAARARRGAIYRHLYRVGEEALTIQVIAERYGITERTARSRIATARAAGKPGTGDIFK